VVAMLLELQRHDQAANNTGNRDERRRNAPVFMSRSSFIQRGEGGFLSLSI
jgi:hypothetical protein